MEEIKKLKDISKIEMFVFDVDGVFVPRGTNIKQDGDTTFITIRRIDNNLIDKIRKLKRMGYEININSGRSLATLMEMFSDILENISITYENGSATWKAGRIIQHHNSFLSLIYFRKEVVAFRNRKYVRGFEQKENIITIHAERRIEEIEKLANKYKLQCIWNGEAYDIMDKKQNKGIGLTSWCNYLKISPEKVCAIGDNYNDQDMLDVAGISISADKERANAKYYIEPNNKLPAENLINRVFDILDRSKKSVLRYK